MAELRYLPAQRCDDALDGDWIGFFAYDDDQGPKTAFTMHLREKDGKLHGLTREQDMLVEGSEARAECLGIIQRDAVSFTKTYTDIAWEFVKPIAYAGTLSADGRAIVGAWSREGLSGTFEMTRDG
ncbi:MAG: hypothetical protein WBA68_05735 [Alteraurantiacibacter sp.]